MRVDDAVRRELERAGERIPTIGIDLDQTVSRGRRIRRRKIVGNVVTAGVMVVVAVSSSALLTSSPQSERQGPAGESTTETTTERTSSPGPGEGDPQPGFSTVIPVLRDWLDAIQEGEEDRAWALMTREAQAILGRSEFDRMMASELPEGLGAFADASDFHYVVVTSSDDKAQVLGVASGELTREGSTQFAAMVIPMAVRGDETLIDDPLIDRDRYYERQAVFASVSAGPMSFRSGDELVVDLTQPQGANTAFIALDDDGRPLPTRFDPGSGRVSAVLDRDLEEGRHVAIVIVMHESGRLYAEPIVFETAAP